MPEPFIFLGSNPHSCYAALQWDAVMFDFSNGTPIDGPEVTLRRPAPTPRRATVPTGVPPRPATHGRAVFIDVGLGQAETTRRMQRNTTNRVMMNLDVDKLKWSKSALPTLVSLQPIAQFVQTELRQAVTEPDKKETPLEKARGHGVPVVIGTGASLEQ
eukprot:3933185-Rhodomonas_salina.1